MTPHTKAAEIAAKIAGVDRDMLLDFAGLEKGKVAWGAAMAESAEYLIGMGLMSRFPNSQITPLGRAVAHQLAGEMRDE